MHRCARAQSPRLVRRRLPSRRNQKQPRSGTRPRLSPYNRRIGTFSGAPCTRLVAPSIMHAIHARNADIQAYVAIHELQISSAKNQTLGPSPKEGLIKKAECENDLPCASLTPVLRARELPTPHGHLTPVKSGSHRPLSTVIHKKDGVMGRSLRALSLPLSLS